MLAGAWLDALLIAVLIGAVALLYRTRTATVALAGAPPREARTALPSRIAARLRAFYPTVARQAGYDPAPLRWFYLAGKLVFALLLPLLLLEAWPRRAGALNPGWLAPVALLGFLLPDFWLLGLRRQRRRQVTRALAFFVDLVVAFLASGLSLQHAFRRAGREGLARNHPLAREVDLVGAELDAGKDPSLAFQALAERTGVAELRGIASSLRIGLRVGTPVRATLQAQADLLWTKRREAALKKINSASIKVMFPVMLCGFPIFFLLTFFPAIIKLVDALRSLAGILR